ncbi:ABC transporter permease [Kribbella sp. VKM Ac-2568]|uniref:ABC transporter permease n=1 Tax=Kribbella sp. VKM Ac-2568 TaxID=2512219 RepID=UPI001042944D|nr:ABC transporter permease [Kribbella sp. VKM Ac-2568]TCM45579.1 ABC-2 type transport system permease protein [Kribbella sp. VKM Ac-2568]
MATITANPARTTGTARRGGLVSQTGYITGRWLRAQYRSPALIAFTLVQPAIWLLLFGQLFKGVVALPGFGDSSYIAFLTPGIVMMTALMTSGWAGTTFIADMERGVMDRMLTSPVRRGALMAGQLISNGTTTVIQTIIVFAIGIAAGARYDGGAVGYLVTIVASMLVGTAFGSLSNAVALLTRQQEALIGIFQFVSLPLTFLSSIMLDLELAPHWVQVAARYNPVDWAAVAARQALSADPDWSSVARHGLYLAAFTLIVGYLSTRAFRTYQRSV